MGYNHYFYIAEKDLLEKIHNFTELELNEWVKHHEDYPLAIPRDIGKLFFEFGKYYENEEMESLGKPLFKDKNLQEIYEEYSPYIVGKEAMLNAIEHQKGLVVKYYEDMLFLSDEERLSKKFDGRPKEKMYEDHIKSMYAEWKDDITWACDVTNHRSAITLSSKYEYSIFELVRLYKSTDWSKYSLIYMGW